MSRQLWIDLLRGSCMLMIIFDHTEICFTGKNIIPYELYVPDVLMAFFFLSGYLFYRPQGFDVRHKFMSVLRSLVMPYFMFVTVLAVPKAFLHGNAVDISTMAWQIVSGQQSWFIAALTISEIVFSIVLWLTKEKMPVLMLFVAAAMALNIMVGSGKMLVAPDYWHVNEAAIALFFIILGYICHRYCGLLSLHLKNGRCAIAISVLLIALLCMKCYTYGHLEHSVSVYALVWPYCSLLSVTLSVMFLFILFSMAPQGKRFRDTFAVCTLSWVGCHSLVYYFFCSGIPTALTMVLAKIGYSYQGHHWEVIPIFFLNVVIITFVVWIVYRYFPWMTGKRRQAS